VNATTDLPRAQCDAAHAFIVAWVFSLAFYFLEYAVRSSPAVMIPQLAKTFGVSTLGVSDILGTYYYTYSTASLVAGVLLDRLGAKYVISIGMAILGVGCLLFIDPQEGLDTSDGCCKVQAPPLRSRGRCIWPPTACRRGVWQPPSASRSASACSAARQVNSWWAAGSPTGCQFHNTGAARGSSCS
jgi:hypothetical protein